jgi:hypothetical protein
VFAGALEWPGWCRSGRTEEDALQALVEYGPRYAAVLKGSRLGFKAPTRLNVVERIDGDASTDFGVPGTATSYDAGDVSDAELKRLQAVLRACWRSFDGALESAHGKALAKGPRGGGRSADKILEHVLGAESGYLHMVAAKVPPGPANKLAERTRKTVLDGLAAAAHGEVPEEGPRGGKRWSARYFARRVAWHVLDHAWEIEDRLD